MDTIVEKALAKWPNVPHCHGWLALDARGNWRMRDQHAQDRNLPGDRIVQPALIGFIRRNYTHDENGCWYFQNGPQRVYVDLEAAPYIAHTDPAAGLMLQTGEPFHDIDAGWMTELGRLFLQGKDIVAMLDDRDMAQCLPLLSIDHLAVTDDQLTAWLDNAGAGETLALKWRGKNIPVGFLAEDAIEGKFGFTRKPRP